MYNSFRSQEDRTMLNNLFTIPSQSAIKTAVMLTRPIPSQQNSQKEKRMCILYKQFVCSKPSIRKLQLTYFLEYFFK